MACGNLLRHSKLFVSRPGWTVGLVCGARRSVGQQNYQELPQMDRVIAKAESLLAKKDSLPKASNWVRMQNLVRTSEFDVMEKHLTKHAMDLKTHVLKRALLSFDNSYKNHACMSLVKSVWQKAQSPATGIHVKESNAPLTLPLKGTAMGLIALLFQPQTGSQDYRLKSIPEIHGLIEAGINIQNTLTPRLGSLPEKVRMEHEQLNKLALLGSDYLLAYANDLVAKLDHPKASEKISDALSKSVQLAMVKSVTGVDVMKNYAVWLFKECGETIVLLADGTAEEMRLVSKLLESLYRALYSVWDEDNTEAYNHKQAALECLDQLQTTRPFPELYPVFNNLIRAAIPIELGKQATVFDS